MITSKSFNFIYPIVKFFLAKILIPIIQIVAWLSTPYQKNKPRKIALLISSRKNVVSSSYLMLIPEIKRRAIKVEYHSVNYSEIRLVEKIVKIFHFFRQYKNADFVFLDDTFLPVSFSFKSKHLSKAYVVQMWHSCGLFKKTGLDTCKTAFDYYLGKANYKNYDLVSVSSEKCREPIAGFMGVNVKQVQALGLSRTDAYFDIKSLKETEDRFYCRYKKSRSKKVIVYAPTYRGEAFNVEPSPIPKVISLFNSLGSEYSPFIAPHPHETIDDNDFNCEYEISSILHLVDVLVTDYSSLAMDYMIANPDGKLILYMPDIKEYSHGVGFYVTPEEITDNIAFTEGELRNLIEGGGSSKGFSSYKKNYLNCCNGDSTVRLLNYLNIY